MEVVSRAFLARGVARVMKYVKVISVNIAIGRRGNVKNAKPVFGARLVIKRAS